MKKNPKNNVNRRHFLKSSGKVAAASAVLSQMPIERVAHAAVGDTVSVALVGCGGRGSGAVAQIRNAKVNGNTSNTKLVAVADVNAEKAKGRVASFKKQFNDWVDVPEDRIFGGLDGYSEAFTALRKISGRAPSISLMFGYNAGGGAYLPRQGSFMIQCEDTFIGLTGPGVVKSVLGEEVSANDLGGPGVHGMSGVCDLTTVDELGSLRTAIRLLSYLPDNNESAAPFKETSDPVDRYTVEEDILFRRTFSSPAGMNAPMDISLYLQQITDFGEYFELQPQRARNLVTAFGRLAGHVVGFVGNNSAVASGQIDIDAALKGTRFIRFCNLYNIPLIFVEDTTGFLPGKDQESRGIILAGRKLLDSIIDIRTPRMTMIIRNAFGGAYASWNSYFTGADRVLSLIHI